jgi:LCP family protein required for cell wall assembly
LQLSKSQRSILPSWLIYALTAAFVFSSIFVAVFAYLTAQTIWNRPLQPFEVAAAESADVSLQLNQEGPLEDDIFLQEGEPTPTLIPTIEAFEDTNRVNILLMGIDRRPGEPFISRTDSMMIISLNQEEETISILSVPRDLYVVIPGRGRDRINTAFVYGASDGNPVNGAMLSMQTLEYNLGVQLDHYVLVDFAAVINGVNAIGGIDVNVPFNINDPTFPNMNYGFDPLFIPAGLQHLDGELALKYARTRHVDSDFGRAQRQQQVVLAVRDKLLSMGVAQLVLQAPTLWQQVEQGIRSDLSLEQFSQLGLLASNIPSESIRNEVLDQNYVSSHTTETGAQVLILSNEKAASLIESLFYDN